MSISLWSGVRGSEDSYLGNINVLKWESRFSLVLDFAKNLHYMRKCFKQNLYSIEVCIKKLVGVHVYLPLEWS